MRKKLTLVIEQDGDDEIGGSVQTPDFLFTTLGTSEREVIDNMRGQMADFLQHEGADNPDWQGVTADAIDFEIEYDLTAVFSEFSAIKIGTIAKLAGINQGLLRQYTSGVKTASSQQAKKVETAIRQLGERLMKVRIT